MFARAASAIPRTLSAAAKDWQGQNACRMCEINLGAFQSNPWLPDRSMSEQQHQRDCKQVSQNRNPEAASGPKSISNLAEGQVGIPVFRQL
jgi:hypothetical protein